MEKYTVTLEFDSIELAENFIHTIKLVQEERSIVEIISELSEFNFENIDFNQFKIDVKKK